ncbi:hypothetical protein ACFQY0_20740 [Haloferula chungangensis]|uniref:Uncharacterized protein n=1 Tax=Haloferula chungangensis TaxID=1048331 RepID=A0ABW2LAY8_9BACT
MKLLLCLILPSLMLEASFGDVLWRGGSPDARLSLAAGPPPLGNWFGAEGDELSFTLKSGDSFVAFQVGMVGPVTGLLREGLAANARNRGKTTSGCTIKFREDGAIDLTFKQSKELTVRISREDARELIRVSTAFLDERMAKHAKLEKNADLD